MSLATRLQAQITSQPTDDNHPIVIEHLIHLYDSLASQIAVRNAADPKFAATNLMDFSPTTLAAIYMDRWEIELFRNEPFFRSAAWNWKAVAASYGGVGTTRVF